MSVWKRLQRVGKKAAKFDFTVSYHELTVECSSTKWIPHKLAVNWTRRSRCIRTKHLDWIASGEGSSTKGYVDWRLPENVHGLITLYHDASSPQFDDKEWTFVVEKHEKGGRFKAIASQKVNMRDYVSLGGAPKRVKLTMKSNSDKYSNVVLVISISSALVKEGMATDEDMQSIASLMSAGPSDVGNLADFDDELPDGGEDNCAAGNHADHAADDSMIRADTMSQLTALTAEISKFTLPGGQSDYAHDVHSPREAPAAVVATAGLSRLKHVQSEITVPRSNSSSSSSAKLLPAHGALLQSASATVLGSAGRRDGNTMREAQSSIGATAGQAAAAVSGALPTAASTSSFVERPFYAGTPPSTPPEERKASVTAAQPRAITPPPATVPAGPCTKDAVSPTAEGTSSASAVRMNPSEDLLNWAKSVTSHYKNIIVTNFTTSWRNGLAFCAVIHHFRPDLIDYGNLVQADVRGNNKLAFDTGALLGIDKILEPSDMMALKVPDKLQVMTYVHAMRSRLDPASAQPHQEAAMDDSMNEQPSAESSTVDGLATSAYSRPTFVVEEVDSDLDAAIACQVYGKDLVRLRSQSIPKPSPSPPSDLSAGAQQPDVRAAVAPEAATVSSQPASTSSCAAADARASAAPSSARQVSRVPTVDGPAAVTAMPAPVETSSPSKLPKEVVRSAVHQSIPKPQPKQPLMTRKQLLNPFDSDDDDEAFVTPNEKLPVASVAGLHITSMAVAELGVPAQRPDVMAAQQSQAAPGKSAAGLVGQNKSRQEELKDRARQLIERARQDAMCAGTEGQGQKAPGNTDSQVDTRQRVRERARLLLEQMSAECNATSATTITTTTATTSAAPSRPVPSDTSALQPTVSTRGSYMKEKGFQFYQFSRKEPDAAATHTLSPALFSEHPFAADMATDATAQPMEVVVGGASVARRTQGSASLNRPCLSAALTDVGARLRDGATATATNGPPADHTVPQMERKGSTFSSSTGSADDFLDASEYVSEELSALEKEQLRLDARASKLEIALRRAMDNGDEEREEKLTRQWFRLVNRKHELIRRQAELNILNKEHDLERRYEMLNRELRHMMALEDWQKSQSQRHREALLLAELVTIVDKRDELVRAMEEQQNALESDQELEKAVHALPIPKEKSCCIQ